LRVFGLAGLAFGGLFAVDLPFPLIIALAAGVGPGRNASSSGLRRRWLRSG